MQLHGQITKFRSDIGVGVISAEDGRQYRFNPSQIVNKGLGLVGAEVDFLVIARQPREIIVMAGSPWTTFGGRA